MPYCQLYYHLVWATKERAPLITAGRESLIHACIGSKAQQLGAFVYAVNGMADHVHLVVAIPTTVSIARFVGQVKASTATIVNRTAGGETPLVWQAGYGAFTVGGEGLGTVIAYVKGQKEHHGGRGVVAGMERVGE